MKKLLDILSFVLITGGVSGLLHEWLGGFRLFGFLRFLSPQGYELYTYAVLVVLGAALGAVNSRRTGTRSAAGSGAGPGTDAGAS